MRIHVRHQTSYRYDAPATSVIQFLRLTPRNHDGQFVLNWRIDVSADCRLSRQEDAFGNFMHILSTERPLEELSVTVEGEVETRDTQGIVQGAVERFPPPLFLRETPLTTADDKITGFAETARADAKDTLALLHLLMQRLHADMTFDPEPTHAGTSAAEAFQLGRGVCQDFAHVFIAAARRLAIPARYVSGHFHQTDEEETQRAGHAWAEAFVPSLGWVAFDPTHGVCATDAHIRIAIGLDYLNAAPVRGSRTGGSNEALSVEVNIRDDGQHQSQSQS